MSRILLIDVMSEAFRAFHALPKTIMSKDGVLINALLGFHNSLKRLLGDFNPDLCLTAWTCSRRTFRHELFPGYKSARSLPEPLAAQKPLISAYLHWLGIEQFSCDGFEADDVLATLALNFDHAGREIVIDSVDKDLWSLCSQSIKVWSPRIKALVGPDEVLKRFQVMPSQIPDLLALIGDGTDGIPRVPGISDRIAVSMLASFGSVREILERRIGELPESLRRKVEQNREVLELNLQLTKLCHSVPLQLTNIDHRNISDRLHEATALFKEKDISFAIPGASTN